MPFTIERYQHEPVLIITHTEPFNPVAEIPAIERRVSELEKEMGTMAWRIGDLRQITYSQGAVVDGILINALRRPEVAHSVSQRAVLVGSRELLDLAAKRLRHEQFEAAVVPMFADLDEALAYIRAEIAKESAA